MRTEAGFEQKIAKDAKGGAESPCVIRVPCAQVQPRSYRKHASEFNCSSITHGDSALVVCPL